MVTVGLRPDWQTGKHHKRFGLLCEQSRIRMPNSELPQLNPLIRQNELTEDGASFIAQATNPFNDNARKSVGYPDLTNGNSFIQVVTLTQTIPVITPTDYHVFSMPILTTQQVFQRKLVSSTIIDASVAGVVYGDGVARMGLLNIATANPNAATMPYTDEAGVSFPANIRELFHFDFSPYLIGNSRLVSFGFEVVNTGPELLKSGAIVTYRSPQSLASSNFVLSDAPENMKPCMRISMPPATASEALLLHGSQQWDAYEGAYCIGSLSTVNNPATRKSYEDLFVEPSAVNNGAGQYILTPRTSVLFPSTDGGIQYAPWNTSGAYVTGATVGTVLTIVAKAYIECFPNPDQKSYVTLTQPAAPYDPMALELYAKASYSLRPATLRSNNPGGEWAKMVSSVIGSVMPRASKAITAVTAATPKIKKAVQVANTAAKAIQDGKAQRQGKQLTKNFGMANAKAENTRRERVRP